VNLRRGRRTGAAGVLASAVLAGVTMLATAGCAPAAAPASASTTTAHDLTIAEAEAAYQGYLAVSGTAAAQENQAQAQSDVAFEQWSLVHSQYTALTAQGTPVPRYQYGQPVFYVPAEAGYPQWFMVAAPRTTLVSGHPGATVNTIMVFERPKAGAPWTLDGAAELDQALPAIALDKDGYATAVRTTAADLLLRPDLVGATQAAVVDEGPASPAAAVIGGGPQTTGLYATQNAQSQATTAQGLYYQWLLQGSNFPEFEVRTADGGALVVYAMYLQTTTEHNGLVSGSPIPVPADFVPLLGSTSEIGYHAVTANWTFEYAAIDPPATAQNAKVQVIGSGGGPTYGHAY
jgi:hypothetical protein